MPPRRRFVLTLVVVVLSIACGALLAVRLYVRQDLRQIRELLRANAAADVPWRFVNAVVAAEDPCHFQHSRTHTLRSAVSVFVREDPESANGTLPHASLANQLVRAHRRRPRPSNVWRELVVVAWIEATENPAQLVRTYAATAYFGQTGGRQIIGVSNAARFYFDKSAGELDTAECASLAAALRSPNVLSPRVHSSRAVERRLKVLSELRRLRFISDAEYAAAVHKVVAAG